MKHLRFCPSYKVMRWPACFMGVDRGHESHESETQDLIMHGLVIAATVFHCFSDGPFVL